MHYLLWLLLSSVFVALGEYYSKKFAIAAGWNWKLLLSAMLVYMIGSLSWFPAIKQENKLMIVGPIWSVLSLLVTVAIGFFIFKEKVSLYGGVGIILALLSICILSTQ